MRVHWRKLGEELGEELGDFPADGSRCVFQLLRCLPARHHVMAVDLRSRRRAMNQTGRGRDQQYSGLSESGNLNKRDVGRKLLSHAFSPLHRKPEGVKVGYHGADVPVVHEAREHQLRLAAQEVKLNVQTCALLQ